MTPELTLREGWNRYRSAKVGAFAAQAAFFVTLSLVPFGVLLSALLRYLPWSEQTLKEFLPRALRETVGEVFPAEAPSATLLSLSAVATLWAASRGVVAVSAGLNEMYGLTEHRNYVLLRLEAVAETLILLPALSCALGGAMWGEKLLTWAGLTGLPATALRTGAGVLILTVFFLLLYAALPDHTVRIADQLTGAAIASVGWTVATEVFSFYAERVADFPRIYGALSNAAMLMLWLYACLYLLFVGAWINSWVAD